MDGALERIVELLPAYGPSILFVLAFLETSFVTGLVVPAGVATSVATVMALEGTLSLPLVLGTATAGAAAGDHFGFWVGRRWAGRTLRIEGKSRFAGSSGENSGPTSSARLVLSQRIKKILTGIQQVGLTVRGFYGEGSEVVGNFFQISNQVTLGESEEETLGKLEQAIGQLLEWENRSQEGLLRDAGLQVEDKILRALGTLKYSRLLGSQELIGLLSAVRFGHTLGMRNVPSIAVLNDLLLKGQPAHLQRIAGREMSSEERNAFRAARVQKALGVEDVPSLQG